MLALAIYRNVWLYQGKRNKNTRPYMGDRCFSYNRYIAVCRATSVVVIWYTKRCLADGAKNQLPRALSTNALFNLCMYAHHYPVIYYKNLSLIYG